MIQNATEVKRQDKYGVEDIYFNPWLHHTRTSLVSSWVHDSKHWNTVQSQLMKTNRKTSMHGLWLLKNIKRKCIIKISIKQTSIKKVGNGRWMDLRWLKRKKKAFYIILNSQTFCVNLQRKLMWGWMWLYLQLIQNDSWFRFIKHRALNTMGVAVCTHTAALSIWKAVESFHNHNLSWEGSRKALSALSFYFISLS